MKEKMKKQNGMGAIMIILLIIVTLVVCAVTFLGVRTIVTGEHFLQPLADMGLVELDEEDVEKENKDEEIKDETKVEDDNVVTVTGEDSSLLIAEAMEEGVECYTINIDLTDLVEAIVPYVEPALQMYMSMVMPTEGTETDISSVSDQISEMVTTIQDIVAGCEVVVDIYANGNELKQVIVTVEYEKFVENVYETMQGTEGFDYESYEDCLADFEATFEEELTTENIQATMAEDETVAAYADYVSCVMEDGKVQIGVDLTEVDLNTYVEQYSAELEELGIDPENVVESAVEVWNNYINENGYEGLLNTIMTQIESSTEVE